MVSGAEVEALIDEHYPSLLAFVRGRLQLRHEAEDIVQETWMRSISAIASGTVLNVRAYLHRVARNLITDHGKEQHLAGERIDETILHVIPDPKVDIERQLLASDELRRIDAALNSMSSRSRTVFVLARVEGLSYAEIGRKLNISRQTVHEHMMRALLILQAEFESSFTQKR